MEEETKTSALAVLASPSPNIPLEESLVTNEAFANTTLTNIFRFLNYKDLLNCSKVCPLWKQIAFQQTLWQHFTFYSCHRHVKQLFKSEYGQNIRNLYLLGHTDSLEMENVKRLIISYCHFDELKLISEINKEIKEFHVERLYLKNHEFELIGQIENLIHVNISTGISDSDRHKIVSDVGLKKLTKLQHLGLYLGLYATCDESFWENIVKMSTLKSLQLTASFYQEAPDPSWVAPLFGPKFLISNLQLLNKLEIHSMTYIHEYDVLKKIKLLANLKELVLDEVSVSKNGRSNFGSLLGQCQNLERLTISLTIPRDESPDIHDIEEILYIAALENSEIVKGVLSLNKTLKHFCWFLEYHEALDFITIYSRHKKDAVAFHSFRVITKNQVRTYVDTRGPGYITVPKLSKIFKKMLPDTQVEIWTPDESCNVYKHKRCYECYK
ncbi:unnamed protein product [Ceutorhynchus assimilis]|uniref:F-box domain-containing protein n=1 Tax=Ceutorhynchus assimilis TaxID=467358 RepID=A0A9N9MXL5_9CUCU|nr:unnamed protein product [Ceutorhynchus assimilis]